VDEERKDALVTPRAKAKAFCDRTDLLATDLMAVRCANLEHGQAQSCVLTERARRWRSNLRPTNYMDPKRMCDSCRAYWHVAMASMTLDAIMRGLPRD
jgi:hypothetical protein